MERNVGYLFGVKAKDRGYLPRGTFVDGTNLLEDMMFNGFLGVVVEDDSLVDCATLKLGYRCVKEPDIKATGNKGGFAVGGFSLA